jgi:hypothetical protein
MLRFSAVMTLLLAPFCLVPAGVLVVGASASTATAQERPLPAPEAFFRAVRENMARAERMTHLFTYKERRTDIHTNPFGKLGTDGTSLFEVYPSPARRLTYRRLIERNGKPVPKIELSQQDDEYRGRASRVMSENALDSADPQVVEKQSEGARQRRQRAIEDVIDTLQFAIKNRTTYDGATAILIAFSPRPTARPSTRQGRMAQKFSGTIWVDEASSEVMRVEAKSTEAITYGGIVARLGEGTTATLTRRPIADRVWMPTELTLAGRGRAVLFRTLVVDYAIEWFDYRRLSQESLTPFLDARIHSQPRGRPE